MAFPVVEAVAESSLNTAGTSHPVTLPAGIVATDAVLIVMDIGSTSATLNALSGWQELLDESAANGLKILWWTGAGVPSTPTFVSSASTRSAQIAYRISGVDKTITPQIGSTATGTSATPNPPTSATPPSSKDYLFVAFFGQAGEEADDDTWVNTPPANYTNLLQKSCGTAGTNLGGLIGAAQRALTTGSAEDPGTFGVDVSAAWRAQTVTIHPAIPTATAAAEVELAAGSDPGDDSGHSVRVVARVTSGAGVIRARLYDGGVQVGPDLQSVALTTSLAEYALTIAPSDVADIGSYAELTIEWWGYDSSGATGADRFVVDQVWLRTPGAGAESHSGSAAISGGGAIACVGTKATAGVVGIAGGGHLAVVDAKGAAGAVSLSGGGHLAVVVRKSGAGVVGITAGCRIAAVVAKGGRGSVSLSGGGAITCFGHGPSPQGNVSISGGGAIAVAVRKSGAGVVVLSGGGHLAVVVRKSTAGVVGITAGCRITVTGARGARGLVSLSGGGDLFAFGFRGALGLVSLSGGGAIACVGSRVKPAEAPRTAHSGVELGRSSTTATTVDSATMARPRTRGGTGVRVGH